MDIYSNNIQQDVPILSEEQIEPLKRVEFKTLKSESKEGNISKRNLYTAFDREFLGYFERLTNNKKSNILEELNLPSDWNNTDRLRNRLLIMKKFEENLSPILALGKKKEVKIIKKMKNKPTIIKKMKPKIKKEKVSPKKNSVLVYKDESFDSLKQVKFTVSKNLYTATDEEFEYYLTKATKSTKKRVFNKIENFDQGWTDSNRLPIRLALLERFRVSISSAQDNGLSL